MSQRPLSGSWRSWRGEIAATADKTFALLEVLPCQHFWAPVLKCWGQYTLAGAGFRGHFCSLLQCWGQCTLAGAGFRGHFCSLLQCWGQYTLAGAGFRGHFCSLLQCWGQCTLTGAGFRGHFCSLLQCWGQCTLAGAGFRGLVLGHFCSLLMKVCLGDWVARRLSSEWGTRGCSPALSHRLSHTYYQSEDTGSLIAILQGAWQ